MYHAILRWSRPNTPAPPKTPTFGPATPPAGPPVQALPPSQPEGVDVSAKSPASSAGVDVRDDLRGVVEDSVSVPVRVAGTRRGRGAHAGRSNVHVLLVRVRSRTAGARNARLVQRRLLADHVRPGDHVPGVLFALEHDGEDFLNVADAFRARQRDDLAVVEVHDDVGPVGRVIRELDLAAERRQRRLDRLALHIREAANHSRYVEDAAADREAAAPMSRAILYPGW